MNIYYTEYPSSEFTANSDEEALTTTKAQLVYTQSDNETGKPFKILRDQTELR